MKVSIITPSYMQGRFIQDCILSVMNQSYKNIQHMILDAGSSDATVTVADRYSGKYDLTFIQEKDSGPASAINKGLRMCSGDIVCWLNADDLYFDDEVIRRVVDLFEGDPAIDVITGNGCYVSEYGKILAPILAPAGATSLDGLLRNDDILQPATFWRRNGIELDEDLKYTFDWDLFIRMMLSGMKFRQVPDSFALYRRHSHSLTSADTAYRKYELFRITKKYGQSQMVTKWNYLMYMLYRSSEILGIPGLKRVFWLANALVGRLSGGRIHSS